MSCFHNGATITELITCVPCLVCSARGGTETFSNGGGKSICLKTGSLLGRREAEGRACLGGTHAIPHSGLAPPRKTEGNAAPRTLQIRSLWPNNPHDLPVPPLLLCVSSSDCLAFVWLLCLSSLSSNPSCWIYLLTSPCWGVKRYNGGEVRRCGNKAVFL